MKETKFKDTEVGWIPADWTIKEIGKICNTSSGGTPSRSNPSFYEGNIPWITTGELKDGYINDSKEHITESAIANSPAKIVPSNTLLMAMYGATIGKLGIINNPSATNQACCAITPLEDDMKYLFYKLLADRTNLISKGCGAGQPNISQTIIKELKYPFPNIQEQIRIASALTSIDNLISSHDKLIEKKKNIKQGTMQQLLSGKKRLKGFVEPWFEKQLGELLQYEQPTKYLVLSTEYSDNGIPVLTAGKTFILGYTNETNGIYNNLPVIIFDDFVTESKYVEFPFKAKSSAMKMLTLRDNNNNLRFVYEIMQMIDFPMTDHKRWWIGEYSHLVVKIPSIDEQKAIASVLTSMDNEISALEAKKAKFESLKQGMMQQLLTGKIRLI